MSAGGCCCIWEAGHAHWRWKCERKADSAKRRNYQELGDIQLPEEEDKRITDMIDAADREIEETRVSFRWGREQLAIVKKAAEKMGVPYQTFMKMCVYERALDLLKDVQAATPEGENAA
jgi:predicted DNA binding CopG/RHH family protein